jgi:hypothetical protein
MMWDWASYSLSDLLMFSPEVYFRLYERANTALWPLQPAMFTLAIALLAIMRRNRPGVEQSIALLLAVLWGVVAWGFFFRYYAQINLAAPWFAGAFGLQALLLLTAGIAGKFYLGRIDRRQPYLALPGLALFLYGLVLHPLVGILLAARSWRSVELFGFAPDPTALGTLGILLLAKGAIPRLLIVIPLLWCLASGLTYWAMALPHGLVTPAVAMIGILLRASLQPGSSANQL